LKNSKLIKITYYVSGETSIIEVEALTESSLEFYMEQYQRNREAFKWEIVENKQDI
jgi:hypothetical protein